MERRPLGKAGFSVPAVGMGTWRTFDVHRKDEERARRDLVTDALGLGMDLFDSSPMYGEAERVLGEALEGRRERALVATKVWTPDDAKAETQFGRALAWYGGVVDVYQVHNLVAWPKRLARLEELRDQGKVRAVGATHWSPDAFPELMDLMRTGRLDMIQVPYNVQDRAVADEVLPLAHDLGLGVLVMRPLGEGDLLHRAPPAAELERYEPYGCTTWPQVLLKWLLSDPRVSSAIPATTNPHHARQNAHAGDPPWFEESERERVVRLLQ